MSYDDVRMKDFEIKRDQANQLMQDLSEKVIEVLFDTGTKIFNFFEEKKRNKRERERQEYEKLLNEKKLKEEEINKIIQELNYIIEQTKVAVSLCLHVYNSDNDFNISEKKQLENLINLIIEDISFDSLNKINRNKNEIKEEIENIIESPYPLEYITNYVRNNNLVESFYELAVKAAACDLRIKKDEKKLLTKLAENFGVSKDFKKKIDNKNIKTKHIFTDEIKINNKGE